MVVPQGLPKFLLGFDKKRATVIPSLTKPQKPGTERRGSALQQISRRAELTVYMPRAVPSQRDRK